MNPGTVIAIVIALLMLLAIWWFMTRAGRRRAQKRYREDARHRTTHDTPEPDNVTASMGAATAPSTEPKGVGPDATAGATGAGASGAAMVGVAAGVAAGTGALKEAATGGSFKAPDVPLAHTDGNLRSQGGSGLSADAAGIGTLDDGQAPAPDTAASPTTLPSAQPALTGDFTVDSGNALHDIREMVKILNLRASDAQRLQVSGDEFAALWHGQDGGMDPSRLSDVAARLRHLLR